MRCGEEKENTKFHNSRQGYPIWEKGSQGWGMTEEENKQILSHHSTQNDAAKQNVFYASILIHFGWSTLSTKSFIMNMHHLTHFQTSKNNRKKLSRYHHIELEDHKRCKFDHICLRQVYKCKLFLSDAFRKYIQQNKNLFQLHVFSIKTMEFLADI